MVQFPEEYPIHTYEHRLRSRYSETDKMGYVYYGRYLEYFEEARTEMIRSMGVSYSQMEDEGIMLPVIHSEIDYKQPLFYDELITIKVHVFSVPTLRLVTYYEVIAEEREIICALGEVSLVFMNSSTRKPCRAPQYVLDAL
jgi:acyl-CoA thioester hydrolase